MHRLLVSRPWEPSPSSELSGYVTWLCVRMYRSQVVGMCGETLKARAHRNLYDAGGILEIHVREADKDSRSVTPLRPLWRQHSACGSMAHPYSGHTALRWHGGIAVCWHIQSWPVPFCGRSKSGGRKTGVCQHSGLSHWSHMLALGMQQHATPQPTEVAPPSTCRGAS